MANERFQSTEEKQEFDRKLIEILKNHTGNESQMTRVLNAFNELGTVSIQAVRSSSEIPLGKQLAASESGQYRIFSRENQTGHNVSYTALDVGQKLLYSSRMVKF